MKYLVKYGIMALFIGSFFLLHIVSEFWAEELAYVVVGFTSAQWAGYIADAWTT